MTEDDEYLQILWDKNKKNAVFNLEFIEIPKHNFDSTLPIQKINNDLKNSKNVLNVAHLNARSVNKNLDEIKEIVKGTDFDVICISESWLNRKTPNHRFEIDGFNIFRNDRTSKRGGGVCCYVRDHYVAKKIRVPNRPENPESIFVEITLSHKKVAIGTLYRPPNIPSKVFNDAFDSLLYIFSRYEEPILTGDFNVNMFNSMSADYKVLNDSIIEPFNLTQVINEPTRITEKTATLLDLFLVKNKEKVLASGTCEVPGVSDHNIIYLGYDIRKPKFEPYQVTVRDFKNFDTQGFLAAAELENFENVYNVGVIDEKITILENSINSLLDTFAPYKTFTITKQDPTPWLDDDIRETMNKRDLFKINFHKTGNEDFDVKYKNLRNRVTNMRRKAFKNHVNQILNSKIKNYKDFYNAARKLKLISDKSNKGKIHFSPQELNDTFLKNNNATIDPNFIQEKISELYSKTLPSIYKFSLHYVSENDIRKVIKSIKSMSMGVDCINIFVIKTLLNRILPILQHIINFSFENGIFPSRWKKATIIPIPKVPIPLCPSDYRPISILTAFSKIIEKLINVQIVEYLNKHQLLDPLQSAYRKYHGTQTALLKLCEDILDAIDDSEVTLLVFLDFSKAFDTVNHELLLAKLDILGFDEISCNWIRSYLSDRYQRVKTDSGFSPWARVLNGVPQGSILGPLLFLILISDMRVSIWNGSYISYADDTNLYWNSDVKNIKDTMKTATSVISNVSTYCKNNCLRINLDKCKYMFLGSAQNIKKIKDMNLPTPTINGFDMEYVSTYRVLGIHYDEVLSWRRQVNIVIGRAMSNFLQINRLQNFLTSESKINLCQTIVLSHFEYCNNVYLNLGKNLQNRIQKMQNICIRFIFNVKRRDHCNYKARLKELNWLNMENRRIKQGLTLIYKILHGLAPNYMCDMFSLVSEVHNVNTRSAASNLWINKNVTSQIHRKAFTIEMAKIYNSIPEDLKNCSNVNLFKKKIHAYLLK